MGTSDIWAPVVAALGASALTGLASYGLDWRQAGRSRREARQAERNAAYTRLLSITGLITQSAAALRVMMEIRSGLGEGLDVALRHRKPVDPLELSDFLRRDLEPLYDAWSSVWTVGTPDAVNLANEVVYRATTVIGVATTRGEAGTRFQRFISGEKWTQEQMDALNDEVAALGRARRDLGILARREARVEPSPLFSEPSATDAAKID